MPDKFVAIDTTYNTPYYRDLIAKGIINKYCVNYVDANRETIKRLHPTETDYIRNYTITPQQMTDLIELGKTEGLDYNETHYQRSLPILQAIVKGLIGRDIYDQTTYSKILTPYDPLFTTALQIITTPATYTNLLTNPNPQ